MISFTFHVMFNVAVKFCEQIYVTGNDGNVICFISFYERQVAFVKQKQNKTKQVNKAKTKQKKRQQHQHIITIYPTKHQHIMCTFQQNSCIT